MEDLKQHRGSNIILIGGLLVILVALITFIATSNVRVPQLVAGPGSYDLEGVPLVVDLDGDSSLTIDTDDRLDISLGGTDRLRHSSGSFTFLESTAIGASNGTFILSELAISGNTSIDTSFENEFSLDIDRRFTTDSSGASLRVEGVITESSTNDISVVDIDPSGSISSNAGVTANMESILVTEPEISFSSGGSVTNASSVHITNAPTEGTNNYGLWVDNGVVRFDGDGTSIFEFPQDDTDTTFGGQSALGRIALDINGTTRYFAYYGSTATSTLREFYTTGDDSDRTVTGTTWIAQTFTVGAVATNTNFFLTSAQAELHRGSAPIGNDIHGHIRRATVVGGPTPGNHASTTIDDLAHIIISDAINLNVGTLEEFLFVTSTQLLASGEYAFIVHLDAGGASAGIKWHKDDSFSTYSGGDAWISTNTGVTWVIDPPSPSTSTEDLMFETYGLD